MKPPPSPGYIGSLSLALLHRWDPERVFVIVAAYIDESGTHGSDSLAMTAYMGDMAQWFRFEDRVGALFKGENVRVFHAKEYRDSDGDFAGWKVDRKTRFLDAFGTITNEELEYGCNTILKISDYKKYYLEGPKPKKARLDTAYGVCFRATLEYLAGIVATRVSKQWPPIGHMRTFHVVIEQGAKNLGDAIRIFHDYKAELLPEYRGLLGTITPERKEDCLPLAISDLVVHGTWRQEEGYKSTWRSNFKLKMTKAYKQNHVRLGVEEAALRALRKIHMERDAEILARGKHRPRGSA